MSTFSVYLKRGTKITVRSDRKCEYKDRLAKDVKVDQTVKLRVDKSNSLKLYAVLNKVVKPNGDVALTVRHLPPFRNEIAMLAVVERARNHFVEKGQGIFSSNVKLSRPEMGINQVQVDIKQETLRHDTVCACCGSNLMSGELVLRNDLTPTNRSRKFKVTKSKERDQVTRNFHFHNCMNPTQHYKVILDDEKLEHVDNELLKSLNDKAYQKARDFQIPWVVLSECKSFFMFAYDTRSLVGIIQRMRGLGASAKYLCRINRTSLNLEQPMSEDQFNFLVMHEGNELKSHASSGYKFVTCAESVDTHEPVYQYGNSIEEIQTLCMGLRASPHVSCYGFADINNG